MKSSSDSFHCRECRDGNGELFPFSMAFQPIVDSDSGNVFAYEALVRGPANEDARVVLDQVTDKNKYAFDCHCRIKALALAGQLNLIKTGASLSINFFPDAVKNPLTCLRPTLEASVSFGIPLNRIIFEVTETEKVQSPEHILAITKEYRLRGLRIALDDFGAGYSGLNLLADLPVDILKLDMALTRRIHERPAARNIVAQMVELAGKMNITLIAEGVETVAEYETLRHCGARLLQGYLFAKPAFEQLPQVRMPVKSEEH